MDHIRLTLIYIFILIIPVSSFASGLFPNGSGVYVLNNKDANVSYSDVLKPKPSVYNSATGGAKGLASFDLSVAGKKVAATVSKAVPKQYLIEAAAECMMNKVACAATVAASLVIPYIYDQYLQKQIYETHGPIETALGICENNVVNTKFNVYNMSYNNCLTKFTSNTWASGYSYDSSVQETDKRVCFYVKHTNGAKTKTGCFYSNSESMNYQDCPTGLTYDSVLNMCKGSLINVPANREQLESDIAETLNGPNKEQKIPSLLDELIEQGFTPVAEEPKAESADPSTVTAPPTTETRSYFDQATSHPMTAVTTTTDTYSIAPTAAGDAFDVSKTSAQTQAITDGATGVTTTSTSAIAYGSDTSTKPVESEQLTDCDKYPDAVGCLKLGTIQSPETLTTTPVNASFTSTSWGSGSCPADVAVAGHFLSGAVFSYAPVCQFLSSLAPVLIAVGWLMAGWFVLGGVRD